MAGINLLDSDEFVLGVPKANFDKDLVRDGINPTRLRLAIFGNIIFDGETVESQLPLLRDPAITPGKFEAIEQKHGWSVFMATHAFEQLFHGTRFNLSNVVTGQLSAIPHLIGIGTGAPIRLGRRGAFFLLDKTAAPYQRSTQSLRYKGYEKLLGIKSEDTGNALQNFIKKNYAIRGFGEVTTAANPGQDETNELQWESKLVSILNTAEIDDITSLSDMDKLSLLYFCTSVSKNILFDPSTLTDSMKEWRNLYFNSQFLRALAEQLFVYYDQQKKDYVAAGVFDPDDARYAAAIDRVRAIIDAVKGLEYGVITDIQREAVGEMVTASEFDRFDTRLTAASRSATERLRGATTDKEFLAIIDEFLTVLESSRYEYASMLAQRHYERFVSPFLKDQLVAHITSFQKMYLGNFTRQEIKYDILVLFELMLVFSAHTDKKDSPQYKLLSTKISQFKDMLIKASVSEELITNLYNNVWLRLFHTVDGVNEGTVIRPLLAILIKSLRTVERVKKQTNIDNSYDGAPMLAESVFDNMIDSSYGEDVTSSHDDGYTTALRLWAKDILISAHKHYAIESGKYVTTDEFKKMNRWMYVLRSARDNEEWSRLFANIAADIGRNAHIAAIDYLLCINEATLPVYQEKWVELTHYAATEWRDLLNLQTGIPGGALPEEADTAYTALARTPLSDEFYWEELSSVQPVRDINYRAPHFSYLDVLAKSRSTSTLGVRKHRSDSLQTLDTIRTIEDRIAEIYQRRVTNPNYDSVSKPLTVTLRKTTDGELIVTGNNAGIGQPVRFSLNYDIIVPVPKNIGTTHVQVTLVRGNTPVQTLMERRGIAPGEDTIPVRVSIPSVLLDTGVYRCVAEFSADIDEDHIRRIAKISSYPISVTIKKQCLRCHKEFTVTVGAEDKVHEPRGDEVCKLHANLNTMADDIRGRLIVTTNLHEIIEYTKADLPEGSLDFIEATNAGFLTACRILNAKLKTSLAELPVFTWDDISKYLQIQLHMAVVNKMMTEVNQMLLAVSLEYDFGEKRLVDLTLEEIKDIHYRWVNVGLPFEKDMVRDGGARTRFRVLFPPEKYTVEAIQRVPAQKYMLQEEAIRKPFGRNHTRSDMDRRTYEDITMFAGRHSYTSPWIALPTFSHRETSMEQALFRILRALPHVRTYEEFEAVMNDFTPIFIEGNATSTSRRVFVMQDITFRPGDLLANDDLNASINADLARANSVFETALYSLRNFFTPAGLDAFTAETGRNIISDMREGVLRYARGLGVI